MATPTFTTLNDPLAANGTYATGINGNGQIVGYYVDGSGDDQGFIYSGGIYTTLVGTAYLTPVHTDSVNAQSASTSTAVAIVPESINNSGEIVGIMPVGLMWNSATPAAFTYQYGTTGVFTPFAMDGLGYDDFPADTYAQGVNNQGQVVGYAFETALDGFDITGTSSLYLLTGNEYLSSFSAFLVYPNSQSTEPQGVNNQGEIVGNWTGTDANFSDHFSWLHLQQQRVFIFRRSERR